MAVAPETTRQSPATLVELIGRETLQSIQDAFAAAFDIPTVILDHEGRNVNAITFRVTFCEDLTRPSSAGDRCLSCDVRAMRESEVTHRPTTFRCWAGLNDSTVPIVSSDGRLFGHFLAGQVHFEEPADYGSWRTIADEIGIDPAAYEAAVRDVRVIPEAVYRHRIDCLGILARMIADQASAGLANRVLLDDALSANEQTRQMTAELEAIASGVSLVSGSDELFATVARLLDAAHDVVAFDGAAVYLRDSEHADLTPILLHDDGLVRDDTYRLAATAALGGRDSVLRDADGTLAIPLVLDGDALGALVLHRHAPFGFAAHDRDLLAIVGGQVTTALGVSRLRDEARRVLSVASVRDSVLRQIAADVDAEVLLRSLLDEALQSLDAHDAALIPRESDALAIFRGSTGGTQRRIDAALEGALWRARTTGKPMEARSAGGENALIVPAAIGSRTGFDLVVWRSRDWTPFETNLARSLAAGAELVEETQRRRDAARREAARQRALSGLISGLQAEGVQALAGLDALVAEAAGVDRVIRVQASGLEGVLIARSTDAAGVPIEQAVVLQGQAALRVPEGHGDPARWDGWAQRVLAKLGIPAGVEVLCASAAPSPTSVALIAVSGDPRGEDARVRLQTVADLLALAATPAETAAGDEGRSILFEHVIIAARTGRTAVISAAEDAYRALGGTHDSFDPTGDVADGLGAADRTRYDRCLSTALAIADDLEMAARIGRAADRERASVERDVVQARASYDQARGLVSSLGAEQPAVELIERIGRLWDAPVLLEDAEGWLLAGDAAARGGISFDLTDEHGAMLGRLWGGDPETVRDAAWEQLTATIALRQILATLRHDDAVRAAVVDSLIEADALTPELRRRCQEAGFEPERPSRVCVIGIEGTEDAIDRAMHSLARWADAEAEAGLVGRRDGVALLIGPDDPPWFSAAIDTLTERFPGIYGGLGHPGSGAPGFQRSYSSARQAADLLRVTGRTGVLEIQDDSLESILLEASDPARLVRFVDSVLLPIEEYDARRGSELMRSLETAVQMGWNLQGAARECHVHVTTFRYRLARIEQLTGVDLGLADGRLTAELALRARRILG